MRLPEFVIDMLDPAGRYLRKTSPRHPRPNRRGMPRQFAEYTPVGTKPRPIADPARRRELLARRRETRPPIQLDPNVLATAAAELATSGHATIGARDATLVRFWHGDAVLDIIGPARRHQTRIGRRELREPGRLASRLRTHLESALSR